MDAALEKTYRLSKVWSLIRARSAQDYQGWALLAGARSLRNSVQGCNPHGEMPPLGKATFSSISVKNSLVAQPRNPFPTVQP
jgi:hypothetical protein